MSKKTKITKEELQSIGNNDYSSRVSRSMQARKKKAKIKRLKRVIAFVLSIVLICVGYIGTDVYMTRHAYPAEQLVKNEAASSGNMADLKLDLASNKIECVSLDNSVMLESVIKDTQIDGYNSITFDAKRSDGTIGYASTLASVDTYGATSNNSTETKESIKKLLANDILPVARISCYRDNVVPSQNDSMALKINNGYYTDSKNNTYLNPNSAATYEYLRDIMQELYSYGVTVFVLTNYNLPSDISANYNDGYKVLADKLNADFDNKIKIIQEVHITITGRSAESGSITNTAIEKEIKKFKKINSEQIYYVHSKLDNNRIHNQLIKNNVKNYIVG